MLVAKKYNAQEGHILHTSNMRAVVFSIATDGSGILVVSVHRSPESTQAKDGEWFLFPDKVLDAAVKLFVLGVLRL